MGVSEWTAWLEGRARAQAERLQVARDPSDRRLAALLELGCAQRALEDPAALEVLLEALDLAVNLGREAEEVQASVELGACLAEHDQGGLGRVHLNRALERKGVAPALAAQAAAELALAWVREGDLALARAALSAAGSGGHARFARGVLARAEGDFDTSARTLEAAIQLAEGLGELERVALQLRAGRALVDLERRRRGAPEDPFLALGAEALRAILVALVRLGAAPEQDALGLAAELVARLLGAEGVELRTATTKLRWPAEYQPAARVSPLAAGAVTLRAWPALAPAQEALARAFLAVLPRQVTAPPQPQDERVRVLQLLDQLLASDLEGTSLFDLATKLAISATGAQRGALVLLAGEGAARAAPPYVSRSLVRRVALTGRPLLVEDAALAPPTGAGESVSAQELRSVLAAPLLGRRGQVLGVLYLDDPGSAGRFAASELSVLTGFANRLGPQLESSLREELRRAKVPQHESQLGALTSSSPSMRAALELLQRASQVDAALLLRGESGVGKEHLARLVHKASARRDAPFVTLACGTLAEDLLESELFGHKAGAFTGAVGDREGLVQRAHGGVLFLDGLDDASPRLQAELLRAVESGEIRPLGGEPQAVDVRFMAGYAGDPQADVAAGKLRQDLLYRLNLLTVNVPPLRERREDIPQLVTSILSTLGAEDRSLSGPALARLLEHEWRGNLRELQACLERALLSADATILPSHLCLDEPRRPGPATRLNRRQLELLDRLSPGSLIKAGEYAERSGVSPATAWRDLTDLVSKGLLRAQGSGRGAAYSLA
ncbi:MAG: sigma 54-interacting transcriptional regulator [Planctomycetes bacterium]|nr:sigma 54-interacting transcriptional regulator [Planctomycetota bacterium]